MIPVPARVPAPMGMHPPIHHPSVQCQPHCLARPAVPNARRWFILLDLDLDGARPCSSFWSPTQHSPFVEPETTSDLICWWKRFADLVLRFQQHPAMARIAYAYDASPSVPRHGHKDGWPWTSVDSTSGAYPTTTQCELKKNKVFGTYVVAQRQAKLSRLWTPQLSPTNGVSIQNLDGPSQSQWKIINAPSPPPVGPARTPTQ